MARVKRHVLLTLFLIAPIACFSLLIWWIFASFAKGPEMDVRGVGQGAGDAGGANAIGELLAARRREQQQEASPRVDSNIADPATSEPFLVDPEAAMLRPLGTVPGLEGQGLAMSVLGGPAGADATREVWVWIPPGVDLASIAGDGRIAMLYILDGETALAPTIESEGREWLLDEIAGGLIATGDVEPMLIIAVPFVEGESWSVNEETRDWLIGPLIMQVERALGVSSDAASRGIMGGRGAGAVALDTAVRRPDVFGKVLAFDPSLAGLIDALLMIDEPRPPLRSVWIMDQSDEEAGGLSGSRRLVDGLVEAGMVRPRRAKFSPVEEPILTPGPWAERMREAFEHAYPG